MFKGVSEFTVPFKHGNLLKMPANGLISLGKIPASPILDFQLLIFSRLVGFRKRDQVVLERVQASAV